MSLETRHEDGAAPGRHRGSIIDRAWVRAVDGLAALGTVMIGLLMVMICADVVARNVYGGSLPLVSELGALTLVMIVFLQLGTTIRNDRLARADFILAALAERRPRAGAFIAGIWDLFGVAVCAAAAWSTWDILMGDIEVGEFIGVRAGVTLETWPFRLLILLGISVAAAQFAVQAWRSFSAAFSSPERMT